MNITLHVIRSFSINNTGGNPAGVVFDADKLTREQKQSIALQAGLSETAFVSGSSVADFKLEFFTPTVQIPHCGHATIATFWFLKSLGKISGNQSSKETIDGTRKVFFKSDEAYMEQLSPTFRELDDHALIYKSIGITGSNLRPNVSPVLGSTGNSFLLIRLEKISDLAHITPEFNLIAQVSVGLKAVGYYVYAVAPDHSEIQTRMFAPSFGINEESATGMAAGPLAAFLYSELKRETFYINQGKYMTPQSESRLNISINAQSESVKSLLVGGSAYTEKTIKISI